MTPPLELWKPIVGFPEYSVSNRGRVRNARLWNGEIDRVKKHEFDRKGYPIAVLWRHNKKHWKKIHRAVVEAFVGPIPKGMVVNHINGIKDDNRLENLEVCTNAENLKHSWRIGTHSAEIIKGVRK